MSETKLASHALEFQLNNLLDFEKIKFFFYKLVGRVLIIPMMEFLGLDFQNRRKFDPGELLFDLQQCFDRLNLLSGSTDGHMILKLKLLSVVRE